MEQTVLQLSNKKLKLVPLEIYNYVHLTSLSMAFNKIPDIDKICKTLLNLKTLNMSNNCIRSLPISLNNLTNLTTLNLYNNKLNRINISLAPLINLKRADFGVNKLNEISLAYLAQCPALTELSVLSNSLKSLPQEMNQMKSLKRLDISFNYLKSMPDLKSIQTLETISISDNYIEHLENLPSSIKEIKSYYNNFKSIKQNNFTQLYKIELKKGEIEEIDCSNFNDALDSLQHFDYSFNRISFIPEDISKFKNVTTLILGNNNITKLSKSLGIFSSLFYIFKFIKLLSKKKKNEN